MENIPIVVNNIDELNKVFSNTQISILSEDEPIWGQLKTFLSLGGKLHVRLNHSNRGGFYAPDKNQIHIYNEGDHLSNYRSSLLTLAHELSHALKYPDQLKKPNEFATAKEYNQKRTMGEAWAILDAHEFYTRHPVYFFVFPRTVSIENDYTYEKTIINVGETIDKWKKNGLSEDKILEELAKLNCGMTGSGKDNYEDWSWTYEQKNNYYFLKYNTTIEQELKEAESILGRQITSEYGMKSLLKFGLFDGYDKAVGSDNIINADEILKYRPDDAGKLQLLMWGGGGNDELYGWKYGDVLIGGEGNDFLYGGEGDDALLGGIGEDYLYGEAGSDTLHGGDGDDYLFGDGRGREFTDSGSKDVLYGGKGNDYLYANNGGINILNGVEGADHLYGGKHVHGQGADYFYADYEDNIYNFSGRGEVYLNKKKLSGGEWNEETQQYEGGGHTYKVDGTTLIIDGKLKIHDFILPGTAFVPGGTYEGLSIKLGPFENEDTPDTTESENRRCPIILDLDKNGIITSGLGNHFFDYDGDGLREKTAWVGKGDGILVRDLNNDGIINNGSELFGDSTLLQNGQKASNGFEALAQLDSNNDGIIDHKDAAFNTLKVWVDANGNGFTEEGELKTLSELGIASIKTGYTNSSYIDANGNAHKQQGEFTFADGTSSKTADVWFKTQTSSRIEDSDITLSADIILMPNAKAFGTVHDLHQAMALDVSLKDLLTAVIDEADASKRSVLLDNLIYRWTGSDSVAANSRGSYIDARIVVALEHLVGKDYINIESGKNPNSQAAKLLDVEYDKFKRYIEATILAQTRYGLQWSVITSGFDSASGGITVNWQALGNKFYSLFEAEQLQTMKETLSVIDNLHLYSSGDYAQKKKEFLSSVNQNIPATFSDEQRRLFNDILTKANSVFGTNGANTLVGSTKDDIIYGGAGDDIITDTSGNNSLYGGDGNDTIKGSGMLNGGNGNDILTGTGINDLLYGGDGNDTINAKTTGSSDTFYFNLGDGQDIIYSEDAGVKDKNGYLQYGKDKIVFGANISTDMISYHKDNNDLIILIGKQNDQITIKDYFKGDNYQTVNQFEFADGTIWQNALTQKPITILGTDGNDTINGTRWNDAIYGGSGNDIINTGNGNGIDYIDGGTGNDTITGSGTLIGGAGDDVITAYGSSTINGGTGNDTIYAQGSGLKRILFNLGDGQDTVHSKEYYTNSAPDTLVFGAGITRDMISYRRSGSYDLTVIIGNQGDQIILKNFIGPYDRYQAVHRFEFADGTVWEDIRKLPFVHNYTKEPINGSTYLHMTGTMWDDVIYGSAGNDAIQDLWGTNYIDGGDGNDTITGNGTIRGGKGNDTINSAYNKTLSGTQINTILFDLGDGQDTINYYSNDGGSDKLIFGAKVSSDMVTLQRDGWSLIIKVGDQGDQIFIDRYFSQYSDHLHHIEFADGTVWNWDDIQEKTITYRYTDKSEVIEAPWSGNGVRIYAGGGDDVINSVEGGRFNYLDGGAGNDKITGGGQIRGGTGNDTIYTKKNVYGNKMLFDLGDGQDTIYSFRHESDSDAFNPHYYKDKIIFGNGITAQMITYSISSYDLVMTIGSKGDKITLKDYFKGLHYQAINRFEFADGTVWDNVRQQQKIADLIQTKTSTFGTAKADKINGGLYDDMIYGKEGNDTITDNSGYNYLDGGAGDDIITGRGIFVGGKGNDTMYAKQFKSMDTFLFNLGDGKDTIHTLEDMYYYNVKDKIIFGAGISSEMVSYSKSGNNLLLTIGNQGDQITIVDYFKDRTNETVRRFEFADGTVWEANGKAGWAFGYNVTAPPVQASAAVMGQVNSLISAMAAFAPEAGSSSMLPTNQYDPSTVLLGASAA